jgi:uncharacterized protein (DUF169 family)
MTAQNDLQKFGEEFERYVRPKYFLLAVKLLAREKDIPEGAIRPKRDLGQQLSLCQAFGLSRREGQVIAMLKEDMWCPEPIICYGLLEPPSYFLEGHMNFTVEEGKYVKDLEAAKNYANSFPRFEVGKYVGVVSAPVMGATFNPDLIIIYCNSAQITQLVMSAGYQTGNGITTTLAGGACIQSVIPSMKTKEYQISIPCGGDRRWAIAQDDELIFTLPREKMEDLMEGLRANATRYPVRFVMRPGHPLPVRYMRTREILGLD